MKQVGFDHIALMQDTACGGNAIEPSYVLVNLKTLTKYVIDAPQARKSGIERELLGDSAAPQPPNQPLPQASSNAQTITYPQGKYVGEVANGKANGQGTYTSATSGTTYTGGFVEDRFNGKGTMTWKDGSKFVGTWVNDIGVQGDGITPDGRVVSGTVKNAKFIEKK